MAFERLQFFHEKQFDAAQMSLFYSWKQINDVFNTYM